MHQVPLTDYREFLLLFNDVDDSSKYPKYFEIDHFSNVFFLLLHIQYAKYNPKIRSNSFLIDPKISDVRDSQNQKIKHVFLV